MGIVAETFRALTRAPGPSAPVAFSSSSPAMSAFSQSTYQGFARAYTHNEVVYAAIHLLATSAGEPQIMGRRYKRGKPSFAQSRHAGYQAKARQEELIRRGFAAEVPSNHPLITLLNNPNPWTTRAELWFNLVMDRYLGGEFFAYIARDGSGMPAELWRLRPDRVRIVPDREKVIAGYVYTVGKEIAFFPAEDVIHSKEPHPLDDYRGLSPMTPIMPRIDIDEAMREFLGVFYSGGGTGPGAILTVKGKLSEDAKTEIRAKLRRLLGGHGSMHETLVLEQNESTYQKMGLDRGLTDAVPHEVNKMNESRLALPFGIPGSILGLLIGYESSSYANKRADWQVLWDVTMTPLMSSIDDRLTKSLCPEFDQIDEVLFDLSDIRALQEDVDLLHDRARKNVDSGLWTVEEGRGFTGVSEVPTPGEHLLLPTRSTLVPTPIEDTGPENPEPLAEPAVPPPPKAFALGSPAQLAAAEMRRLLGAKIVNSPSLPAASAIVAEARCECGWMAGKNVNVGAELWCKRCRQTFTVSSE